MSATSIKRPLAREHAQADSAPSAIEADNLEHRYAGRRALNGVSFSIARGEMFGFLGPNGSGKTTLFRVLSTLLPVQGGVARVLGRDLSRETREVRRRVGVVFQYPSVDLKLTVRENLVHHGHLYGIAGAELRERAAAMLELVGLSARASEMVETLSGGLRRRVELAKALLHQPELLLLDEPTTGLDPSARREFLNHLDELRRRDGTTVVMTTHHTDEAERCERVAILDEGRLVACAPPQELKAGLGGDVLVLKTGAAEAVQGRLERELRLKSRIVDGTVRIERPRAHEIVREVVDTLGGDIHSLEFGRPTLEDVFVHLTGRRFIATERSGAPTP
ncbi:MAG: ATP-binding cassette domain-containing protein [Candidatus Binataceae bacterium]